jgi:hypothetical protein
MNILKHEHVNRRLLVIAAILMAALTAVGIWLMFSLLRPTPPRSVPMAIDPDQYQQALQKEQAAFQQDKDNATAGRAKVAELANTQRVRHDDPRFPMQPLLRKSYLTRGQNHLIVDMQDRVNRPRRIRELQDL